MNRLYENKAQLNSINMQLKENVAIAKVREHTTLIDTCAARTSCPPHDCFFFFSRRKSSAETEFTMTTRRDLNGRRWATSRRVIH